MRTTAKPTGKTPAELLEENDDSSIEKKYLRKDGSSIWVNNNVSLVPGTESAAIHNGAVRGHHPAQTCRRSSTAGEGYLAENHRN
jgi:hypothetical protein